MVVNAHIKSGSQQITKSNYQFNHLSYKKIANKLLQSKCYLVLQMDLHRLHRPVFSLLEIAHVVM